MKDSLLRSKCLQCENRACLDLPNSISPCSNSMLIKETSGLRAGLLRIPPPREGLVAEPLTRPSHPTRLLSPNKPAFKLWFISQSRVSLVGVSHASDLADLMGVCTFRAECLDTTMWPVTEGSPASPSLSICAFISGFHLLGWGRGRLGSHGRGSGLFLLTPFTLTFTDLEKQGEERKDLFYLVSCQIY